MGAAAPVILSLAGLGKSYHAPVLAGVSLELRAGEVHALVGENGAGKSTLSRIVAGLTRPDTGSMRLADQPYAPADKPEAERLGVRMVLQELSLISNLTVAENLFLRHLPNRAGWINYATLHDHARTALARVGLADLDPQRLVRTLGVGQQQLVEIAAGLIGPCRVLILDEPTAALAGPEIDRLFEQIKRLRQEGTAILYISHRMEEIQRISDRITVLRDGCLVETRPAAVFPLSDMVRAMVGREVDDTQVRTPGTLGPVALRVRDLCAPPAVHSVSFEVRAGEILGLAGLMGAGRTELVRAIFGADPRTSGGVYLHGSATPADILCPRDAVRQGLALLTEDRKQQGLLLPLPVRVNITLNALARFCRRGWIRRLPESLAAASWVSRLGLKCASPEQPVRELSGGNQQKAILARWLLRDCRILIFDEPTRGIDVGAKFEIYQWLNRLTGEGKAVVVVSSDLKELLAICDRIAVMAGGRLTATFARGEWTQEKIMQAAVAGTRKAEGITVGGE